MKKRIFAGALALMLLLGALSGCGKSRKAELENPGSFGHVTLSMPKGFKLDDQGSMAIITGPDYPLVSDNIAIVETKETREQYSRDMVEATLGAVLQDFSGLESYDELTVDGHDAIRIRYSLSMGGISMRQTQYAIFGKGFCDGITFTSVTGNYDADFDASAASILVD